MLFKGGTLNWNMNIQNILSRFQLTSQEALVVKKHWRSDTWEAPGGQVEEGEPLDKTSVGRLSRKMELSSDLSE